MKRLMCLLLSAALCLSLCACGGSTSAEPTAPPPETAPPAPTAAPEPTPQPTPAPTPEPEKKQPDFSAFAGCWKYDAKPFYLQIEADGTWRWKAGSTTTLSCATV